VEQIRDLTKDLIDAQRGGSIQEVNDVLQNIIEAVSLPDSDLARMRQAMDLMENVASFTGEEEEVREREDFEPEKLDRVGKVVQLMSIRVGKKGTPIKPKPVTKSILKQANKIIAIEDAAVNELNSLLLNKGDLIGWFDYTQRANVDRPLSSGRIEELGAMDVRELINLVMNVKNERGDEPFKFIPSEMSLGGERATSSMKGDAMEEAFVDYGSARIMPSYGKGLIKGKGLRSERFPQRVDYEKGIKADKTYIPFGKYALNSQKLAGGTLMIKTMKGGAIPKLPTIGISPALGGIIKKMIGGGLPSYNEMSSLSDEDKNTLYKVFKLSQIDKADLLPAPDKTKEEQEMNRFQILKGQIQAGNDNKELIKEFKVLLLKFINGGKIPKAQGMDIITELMAMGH